jgi:outer membrane cobalamin receptor
MSNTRSTLCLWTVTSLTAGPAFADNPDDPIRVGEPIIVTATRTAQTIDDTLASVTVIIREEIERRQPNSVQDVLRGVPGLGVTNSGGLGKQSSVFLRGTNSDHVLVLIAIMLGGVSDWCVTPAYGFLIPTYACLWYGGRGRATSNRALGVQDG